MQSRRWGCWQPSRRSRPGPQLPAERVEHPLDLASADRPPVTVVHGSIDPIIDVSFGRAYVKSQTAAGTTLPTEGLVFMSLNDADKPAGIVVAKRLRCSRQALRDRRRAVVMCMGAGSIGQVPAKVLELMQQRKS